MTSIARANSMTASAGRQSWNQILKVSGCVAIQHRDASKKVSTNMATYKRGSGGRSSFSGTVATVFGASGFLGRYVANQLGKVGSQVVIPYRSDPYEMERLRLVGDLGQVIFCPFELRDEESIRRAVKYSNVVINLVGREYETKNYPFNDVHVNGARRIARLSKEAGVEQFIHMSHLNAKEDLQKIWNRSELLRTKYLSELAVREEFPEAIIMKPSDMFGFEDNFLNHYKKKSRWSYFPPGIPLWRRGESTIKQPVFVGDVAKGIVQAIRQSGMEGKNIECVGPQRFYLADIVDFIMAILRREDLNKRRGSPIAALAMRARAQLFEYKLIGNWGSRDKLEREFLTDWTSSDNPNLEDLGVSLTELDTMARHVLFPYRKHAYYAEQLGEFAEPAAPRTADHYVTRQAAAVPSART